MIVKIWAFLQLLMTRVCKCKHQCTNTEKSPFLPITTDEILNIVLLKALQIVSFLILWTSKHFILTNTVSFTLSWRRISPLTYKGWSCKSVPGGKTSRSGMCSSLMNSLVCEALLWKYSKWNLLNTVKGYSLQQSGILLMKFIGKTW